MAKLDVFQLPVLTDNYIYVLREDSGCTAVVDPAVSTPVIDFLRRKNWSLNYILNTHHHPDHVGGNLEIKKATGCEIVAAACDARRIPGYDILVEDGDDFPLGECQAHIKEIPGHTLGHIAFYFADVDKLFCGDTLFAMGCGRLFEGTPAQMWKSLEWIKKLPKQTQVYCAHEYSKNNAEFALTVEPENIELQRRYEKICHDRAQGLATVPMSLEEELQTNPFLRTHENSIKRQLQLEAANEVDVLAQIRKLKDSF